MKLWSNKTGFLNCSKGDGEVVGWLYSKQSQDLRVFSFIKLQRKNFIINKKQKQKFMTRNKHKHKLLPQVQSPLA